MNDLLKILSDNPSLYIPSPTAPEDPQINLSLESNFDSPSVPVPKADGLFNRLLSLTRSPLSGLAQLFSPASPMSVNISASTGGLYFGRLNVYGSASRSFALTNNGDSDAQVMLSTGYPFSVSSGRTIKAGESAYFTVSFNPTQAGFFHGYVTGNYGVSIALDGQAVDPYKN